jgi:outer membrane protein OmpA-like peptidoglycan-associated protein
MKTLDVSLLAVTSVLAVACSTTPAPKDLMDARAAYEGAANGPAAQLDPAGLHVAREELAAAERSFSNDGDSFRTRDLAYVAIRKAQLADATARATEFGQKVNMAEHQVQLTQAEQAATTKSLLSSTQAQLATDRERLAVETQQREAAEKRARQALDDLARIASVKQDTRGTVITLSGGVLFASAKSDLLPAAQANLAQVAEALSKSDPDSKITVAGYTDSQGGLSYNQDLSQRRAESVRAFLVSHGVAPDRITAQGFGPAQPIADNASPEGRADNRRVEIVVQPKTPSSSQPR